MGKSRCTQHKHKQSPVYNTFLKEHPEAKHDAEEKCERPVRVERDRQRSFETRTWTTDQMASSRACIWLALVVCDSALYSTPQAFDIDIVRCRVTFSCFSR